MSTGNGTTVPIAPSTSSAANTNNSNSQTRSVASTDIVFVDGQAFNGRGFRVCGVANQRGTLCGRIGSCPFHAGKPPGAPSSGRVPKRRRTNPTSETGAASIPTTVLPPAPPSTIPLAGISQQAPSTGPQSTATALPHGVRRMNAPPTKGRFKRSWTPAEHRQFLASMKKFGKGKWKEIAREVKTRTANQCQSHAQKYFLRQAKSDAERKKKSIHDLTEVEEVPHRPHNEAPSDAAAAPHQQVQQLAAVASNATDVVKLEPLTTPTMPGPLPSPPPPVQSPSVYFSPNPPSFPLQQDKHPAISNVNTLASAALATAPSTDAAHDVEHSKVTAMVNAALKNASSTPLSNGTVSEGASNGSSVREEKSSEGQNNKVSDPPAEDEDQLEEATVSDDADGGTLNPAGDSIAAAVHAAANVQMQALAQAAQVALATGTTKKGDGESINRNGGATNGAMMSALHAPLSQLMSNPQALMLLNPILANMSGLNNISSAGTSTIAPPPRLRVTVHVNGRKGGGMALVLPESNAMDDFFKLAQNVLNHAGTFRRVFTRSGGEITSLDQMVQDDALWLSDGEDFATPWPR